MSTVLVGASLVAFCIWAYAPGLHGGFLFDDFGNLPALGSSGPVDNWATFFRYITSGAADPTGRPLTLLSFLIDARDWPASPYPFKRTNLILHVINAVLLALLLRRLGRCAFPLSETLRVNLAALLGAAFWMLHPLLISTTLYIVQREAMLPVGFTLLGLLIWLHGREAMLSGSRARGLFWIVAGLGACTLLGVLSKANGALLPALALVIEYIWLQHRTPTATAMTAAITTDSVAHASAYRRTMLLFGWLPSTLLAGYLLHAGWSGFVNGVSALRPWTMGQRLLTEPRVLIKYLDLLWLPRPFTPGLFNDQIHASISLWSPVTTLPALFAVLALIVGAWCLRRRFPALALAILFYFVGQALESTTLQLELYFEHRNYLPAMLMFWPLALWLCSVRQDVPVTGAHPVRDGLVTSGMHRAQDALHRGGMLRTDWAKLVLTALILLGLGLMTHARASLWGNTHDQGLLWARLNPASPRAQANAALLEMAAGEPRQAVARLTAALPTDPDQVQLSFNLIGAHCMLGDVPASDIERARRAISGTRDPGTLLVHWFDSSIEAATAERCRGLTLHVLDTLLDAGLANHHLVDVDGRHQDLLYLKGHIALARHDPAAALRDFNASLALDVRPGAALNQAALLGSAGYPREGLAHLDYYQTLQRQQIPPSSGMPWLHAKVLQEQDYWPKEIRRLRDTLLKDAQTKAIGSK